MKKGVTVTWSVNGGCKSAQGPQLNHLEISGIAMWLKRSTFSQGGCGHGFELIPSNKDIIFIVCGGC